MFANFFASFEHKAKQILRNIPQVPHHTQQDSRIFAQNYLHNLLKNQNCAKLFVQIAKLRKKQHFEQKLNPCVKT